MTQSTIDAIQCIIQSMWTFATGWRLPGINCTPAQLGMLIMVVPLILWFVKSLLSLSFGEK